ncbi:MAG: hypothetical protein ABW162_16495 [Candidatus Sedimenticola sp. PURPLELP]
MSQLSPAARLFRTGGRIMGQTVMAYALSCMLLLLGVWLGYATDDWYWVSRAGSVIVVLGLILTSQQIFQHLDYLRRQQMGKINDQAHRSTHDWAIDVDKRGLLDRRYSNEVLWHKEAHGFYLLTLGTLVWGFGDLMGRYIFSALLY